MVKGLATVLVDTYARRCERLLDPFCGSGELLIAASNRGIPATGFDINPFAILLSTIRVQGFEWASAALLLREFLRNVDKETKPLPIALERKHYWFTAQTLSKIERMRHVAKRMALYRTAEGRSVLLALALAMRLCSRADDRSPKPFVSKEAQKRKLGRHLDPTVLMYLLHLELQRTYGARNRVSSHIEVCDMATAINNVPRRSFSHVITSPPYLNAQDYYRNFKFELEVLRDINDGDTPQADEFIGTERGSLLSRVTLIDIEENRILVPQLRTLEARSPRHAEIVHRYLVDMKMSFRRIQKSLKKGGVFVIVCGDNLVGNMRIGTGQVLNDLIESMGFRLFDSFHDPIRARALAPTRAGHKGLIKEERISAFRLLYT